MKLNCPECGASIPSENINIQKMVAVCPDCGAVFSFEAPQSKSKRRKVHQPQNLELRDTDQHLHMAFRTNFRLGQDGSFISSSLMSVMFTFITLLMASRLMAGAATALVVTAGFSVFTLSLYYWLATIVYNKTHIEMNDEKISVSRGPIPVLLEAKNDVNLAGVTVIRYEETPISKREGYDLPRYNVWAETADGSRKIIVRDMTEEYAVFISQRLNEQLALDTDDDIETETDVDVSRLSDDDSVHDIEDDLARNAMIQASQNQRRS